MNNNSAEYWIEKLGLQLHPEGGYYKEVFRSQEEIPVEALPERYSGTRSHMTSILFLLKENQFSAFHRLQSDEIWHYHMGGACEIHIILPDGSIQHKVLGPEIEADQHLQLIVPHDSWFAAHPMAGEAYTLVGCTMAPGFSFEDFELGSYEALARDYPEHREIIRMYTRN